MPTESQDTSANPGIGPPRLNILTLVSVAVVACTLADMVHEALGHGIASWLVGDPILSISTVAMQHATANRFVSACGTTANCLVGVISMLLFRRAKIFSVSAYFFWLFGVFNLLNSGYLVYSAILESGDWANVIAGLSPPLFWRGILALAGATIYGLSIRWSARSMIALVENGEVDLRNLHRLILPAYLAGGAVMTIASVFNPISPSLILLSGAGASFGLNSGMLFIPRIVANNARSHPSSARPIPLSRTWLILAIVVALTFIAILGPGIHR